MKKLINTIAIIFLFSLCIYAQKTETDTDTKSHTIGIQYFGEMGLHPGLELDYSFPLLRKEKIKEKRSCIHQFKIRPSIVYYQHLEYSRNYLLSSNFDYQFRVKNNKRGSYLFLEPYFKIGYLRYSYIGTKYETTDQGNFIEKKLGGGNAFIFGSGLYFGGSIIANKLEWIFASEYLGEVAEGPLFVHHINFKLGTRIIFQKNEK